MTDRPTAGLVVIGNELLTGKIVDENTPWLAKELRALGILLRRVVVVEDDLDAIADEVRLASQRYTWVFTSGGLGPTHDDVTMEAVARAFDCALAQSPQLLALLDGLRGNRPRQALERLTWIPERGKLFESRGGLPGWPTVHVDNVFIFPGVPRFMRARFDQLKDHIRSTPFASGYVDTTETENAIVGTIDSVDLEFAGVDVGSYPKFGNEDHRTRLCFDASDAASVNAAIDHVLRTLDADAIVRVVRPD